MGHSDTSEHEARTSEHEARSAEGTDVSKRPPNASDLTMHGVSCIARLLNDWILEHVSNFRALCESMHDFSYIVEITIVAATPTML